MRITIVIVLTYIMGITTGLLYNSSGSSKNMNITVQIPPTVVHKDTVIEKPDIPQTVVHCTYHYKGITKFINSMWPSGRQLTEKEIKENIESKLEDCYGVKINDVRIVEDAFFLNEKDANEYYKWLMYKR